MERTVPLGELSAADWERLQDLLDRFETAWQQASAPAETLDLCAFLPPAADPLHRVALQELIKSDLEIRCRRGLKADLESYLARFPELGSLQTLSPDLIYEEYWARQRHGDHAPLDSYASRFPNQFAELRRLVQEQPVPQPTPFAERVTGPLLRPPSKQAMDDHQELRLGGVYKPIKRLGKGAFGEIWRAEAPGGVEVAIKVIYGSAAQEEVRREIDALELMKRLRHVYLLSVHHYHALEDRLLIVMELADCSLRDRLEELRRAGQSSVPLAELLGYFREAAEALDYLHAKHVLHRDIKPENILTLGGHVKVADFGLARVLQEGQRLVSCSSSGTPVYLAPEVYWAGKVGANSDQYSLAATYVELRLGHPLFRSTNPYQLQQDKLKRSPDLVPLLQPEQMVLRRALDKDPDQRFRSCLEFVHELSRSVPRDV
jgi:serine/threonine protein kinase